MADKLCITDISLDFIEGQEILNLGGNYYPIDKNGLSLTIASIPESILYHISQNVSRNRELFLYSWKQTIEEDRITNHARQIATLYTFVEEIRNEIISLDKYENAPAFFIILYPLLSILVEYRVHYGFKTYTERTPEYVRSAANDYLGYLKGSAKAIVKNPIKEIFKEKTSESELVYQATEDILFYLYEGRSKLQLTESNLKIYFRSLEKYSITIIKHIKELLKLKLHLEEYLELQLKEPANSFEDTPNWIKASYFESRKPFNILSLPQAISIEQHHILNNHKYYKICQICGRPFYANKSNSKYCNSPNSEYNGKTCKEIGNGKIKASKSPLHQKYLSHQKVYRNWINRNKKAHPEILESPIIDEIEKKYKAWNAQALDVISLFENGDIDFDKAVEMMMPPENSEKSYLLDRLLHK